MAQGQSLRARLVTAPAAWRGLRRNGLAGRPTSEVRTLPAARLSLSGRANRVAQLQPQRLVRAPSLHPSARPGGGRGLGRGSARSAMGPS